MSFIVIVPTLNAGDPWSAWIDAMSSQIVQPDKVFVIDSGSGDGTVTLAHEAGYKIDIINKHEFNHGGTRNKGVLQNKACEFIVFLTQDAILADTAAIKNILLPFEDEHIAAVCGRQLPRTTAGTIEAHARLFNYGDTSFVRCYSDRKLYGIKTAFLSNSFAAYRVSALLEQGGFPDNVIFGEDMYVAARLLQAGWKVAYAADACVYHSHCYTFSQELKRYFDMGVFHAREPWIRKDFGRAESEGSRFVRSEMHYLVRNSMLRIPEALARILLRYTGFRLGLYEARLPVCMKRYLSMNPEFFEQAHTQAQ